MVRLSLSPSFPALSVFPSLLGAIFRPQRHRIHSKVPSSLAGAWLVDLASLLPVESENTYIGTDITVAYFPRPAPNGIHLQEQSITKPWPADWAGMFDLVHQRMALPAAGKDAVKETIANMIALLKPGGWIQFVESDHSIAKGPAMTDMYKLISDLFNMMGTGADYGPQLEAWFAELGLVNVGARVLDVPLGKDNPKEEMKAMSTRCFCLANKGTVKVGKSEFQYPPNPPPPLPGQPQCGVS